MPTEIFYNQDFLKPIKEILITEINKCESIFDHILRNKIVIDDEEFQKEIKRGLKELNKKVIGVIMGPEGEVCECCNGTGSKILI